MLIEDGKGTGSKVRVDQNNVMHVHAIAEPVDVHAVDQGDAYNINTGNITFTAAGSLIYLKNNENQNLIITAFAVGVGTGSTSDMGEITVRKNDNAGDLITDETAVSMNSNRLVGSSKTLTVDAFKGKSSGTSTGGEDMALFYQGTNGRLFAAFDLLIEKGSSVSIMYDPKLSSGNVKAYCALICYLKDPIT
jgi:hypothetical protein